MFPSTEITKFSLPTYYPGKQPYVGFYAFDPETNQLKRKRYKLGHIKDKSQREMYAKLLICQLTSKLITGWTPFLHENSESEITFAEVSELYLKWLDRQLAIEQLRPASHKSYKSYFKVFSDWLLSSKPDILFSSINTKIINSFLDYLIDERNLSVKTRNHYLVWLGTFYRWANEKSYCDSLPTESCTLLRTDRNSKNRTILTKYELESLKKYLQENNPSYLIIIYLIYYCFLRPKEISYLKLSDFNLHDSTIHISADIAKNHREAKITMPIHLIHLLVDLNVFQYPSNFYLIGRDFKPGKSHEPEKRMQDYWNLYIRPSLHFGLDKKLYSLKDTGISSLLQNGSDVLSVRNQARHSDLSITNIYASRTDKATKAIMEWNDF